MRLGGAELCCNIAALIKKTKKKNNQAWRNTIAMDLTYLKLVISHA